ncbi:MAG: restriction endonuclease subunit S [Prevotella melaninogenica]
MEYVSLKEVVHIKHGYAFKGEFFTEEKTGKIVLTPGNFSLSGGFIPTKKYTKEEGFPEEFILKANDLIVTMTDLSKEIDTIGFAALIPSDDKLYLHNQRIGLVTIISNDFDKDYIYWLMRTKCYQRTIANTSNGATVHHTSPDRIYKYKFKRISLPIQQKIASILSAYDRLIENNTRRIRLLEQMAENLYKEWFVRFRFPEHEKVEMVNGLPKGWKVEKIKECVKRLPFGRTYKAKELSQDGEVIVIDQSTSDFLGFHNNTPDHHATFNSPIILFGDHSCKFCLMTRNFSLGENIIPFISKDTKQIDNYYLYFATHKLIVTEEYKRHWGRLSSMKILIPTIDIQQKFNKLIIKNEKMKKLLFIQNQLLTRQRDLLLPRLMSGKLEVKS